MNKIEIRKLIKERKSEYRFQELKSESERIIHALENCSHFRDAHTALLYHSLPDEVCTHEFIIKWHLSKRILLPKVQGDELTLHVFSHVNELRQGSYRIMEPHGTEFSQYDDIDLAIVPGVAFDRRNNRLGRGKGFYDRLLPQLRNAYKIGICFPFQFVDEIPVDTFDVPMDMVIC